MKLLQEHNTEVSNLYESVGDRKRCYIEGIFLQGAIKNKNGRIYPVSVLEEAVNQYQEKITNRNAIGELNHPTPARPDIDYDRACIKIESLTRSGNDYIGKALVTNTIHGRQIEGLIGDGVRVGVSSRALAAVKQESGSYIVQPGMYICTAADVVSDPSAPKAFVEGIMENTEWIMKDGLFLEKDLHEAKELVQETKSRDLEKVYQSIFNSLIGK